MSDNGIKDRSYGQQFCSAMIGTAVPFHHDRLK